MPKALNAKGRKLQFLPLKWGHIYIFLFGVINQTLSAAHSRFSSWNKSMGLLLWKSSGCCSDKFRMSNISWCQCKQTTEVCRCNCECLCVELWVCARLKQRKPRVPTASRSLTGLCSVCVWRQPRAFMSPSVLQRSSGETRKGLRGA